MLLGTLAANVSDIIKRNPPFCSFAPFLFVSLIHFIINPDSSSDLTIFIISSISSFEINNAVVPDPSVGDAGDINPNGIKTLLANGLSTFSIKGNPVFSNGPKKYSRLSYLMELTL